MKRQKFNNLLTSITTIIVFFVLSATNSKASYAIYVGKNLTKSGNVLFGGSGDEVSSHWLEIVDRQKYSPGTMMRVGVDETAYMPGVFIDIPQVQETFRYLTMNYSDYEGFPAPLKMAALMNIMWRPGTYGRIPVLN